MALLALNLQPRPAVSPARESEPIRLRVGFDNLGRGARPGRGLLYSFFMHEAILAAVLWAPLYFDFGTHPLPLQTSDAEELAEARQIIYLPRLGGGSEAAGLAGAGSVIRRKGSSDTTARASEGFTYPGQQAIISDPPQPTNRIQTILQPGIKHPAPLKPLIPLPNIVQTANAGPLPDLSEPAKLIAPVPAELKPKAPAAKVLAESAAPVIMATTAAIDPSKLSVPTGPVRPAVPTSLNAPKPRDKAASDAAEAAPSQYSPTPTRGTDLQNLLVLSPTPVPPAQSAGVPAGESRGRFAVSPEPSAPSPEGPGSKSTGSQTSGAGLGSQTEAAPNSASDGEVGISNGAARLAPGGGGGTGLGTGKTTGSGNGGTGTSAGRGSGSGAGVGTGAGTSAGSGAGAGGGSGGGAFAGMTIQGGSLQNGSEAGVSPRVQFPTGPRPVYGMTVVSTANSGSGLGDFGVFAHEQVYTVYVDMRNTVDDRAPSWTLQCAVLPADAAQPDEQRPAAAHGNDQGFVPPFPVVKERPQLPNDLVTRYLSRMLIVYGVIDTDGKLSQLSVRQSPDIQLNKPTLEGLAKWTFRPAEENGNPVRVKVLLGIPLALAE